MGLVATCFRFWLELGWGCIWLPRGSVLGWGCIWMPCNSVFYLGAGCGVGAAVTLVDNTNGNTDDNAN